MNESAGRRPLAGTANRLAEGLRMVLAPNPSPMTHWGTNTFIVGDGEVAVIDPGPADAGHLAAIQSALGPGERISHIFVTHSHLDHSPLARALADRAGAPILAFGPSSAGRTALMEDLAARGGLDGGEGVDHGFCPDSRLSDGDRVVANGWTIRAIHTPGHFSNHMSFEWKNVVFTGDHVMEWASSLVSPPDGNMGDYMASLNRLATIKARRLYPAHGRPIDDPAARISALITHRLGREASILDALKDGPATASDLALRLYVDTPSQLMPAAVRNVLAHLIDLMERNRVTCSEVPGIGGRFRLI